MAGIDKEIIFKVDAFGRFDRDYRNIQKIDELTQTEKVALTSVGMMTEAVKIERVARLGEEEE